MRQRLLLTLALAVLGAVSVTGAVSAQSLLEQGSGKVDIDLGGGEPLPDVTDKLPACSNTKDDDGDGKTDLLDPGCSGPTDNDETDPPAGGGDEGKGGDDETTGGGGKKGGGGGKTGTGKGTGGVEFDADKQAGGKGGGGDRKPLHGASTRSPDGKPTMANPTVSVAQFRPVPIGVSDFTINQFEIPPFLLPLYQACGTQYGIPWQVLAAINRVETLFGQVEDMVSSAGAVGWMQFLPSTWKVYGVDANNDGRKDPYNPVDAICAAGRYLKAAGGEQNLRRAVFAYNHADWYVDEVLAIANQYGKLPESLVGGITGLTEAARFPVAARARYADDVAEREVYERANPRQRRKLDFSAAAVESAPTGRGVNIYAKAGAPVVAVKDGVIKQIGRSEELGKFIVLQDAYRNRYIYGRLGRVADVYPVPKERKLTAADFKLVRPKHDQAPSRPASAKDTATGEKSKSASANRRARSTRPGNTEDLRPRLYAFPERPKNRGRAELSGQLDELLGLRVPGYETFKAYFGGVLKFDRKTMEMRKLKEGSRVTAGTVLGKIGKTDELAPYLHFAIKPTGRGAKLINPKPILDTWQLLQSTAIYRAAGKSPFNGAGVSQVLLMSKPALERHVLANPRLEIYSCGRRDVGTHQIDVRVLRTLGVLAARGFRLTVTSLRCGHSVYTSTGNVSHHSFGGAVDIARVNGLSILGNQGRGSITEMVVRELMRMQEPNRCDQIISLMKMGGPTFAMSDHADHIHCGFAPSYGTSKLSKKFVEILEPDQWQKLIDRIGKIDNPKVSTKASKYALPAGNGGKRASDAHIGE